MDRTATCCTTGGSTLKTTHLELLCQAEARCTDAASLDVLQPAGVHAPGRFAPGRSPQTDLTRLTQFNLRRRHVEGSLMGILVVCDQPASTKV